MQGMWQGLTPDIFALFWTLTAHDLYVPAKAYESELEKVSQQTAVGLPINASLYCCCHVICMCSYIRINMFSLLVYTYLFPDTSCTTCLSVWHSPRRSSSPWSSASAQHVCQGQEAWSVMMWSWSGRARGKDSR